MNWAGVFDVECCCSCASHQRFSRHAEAPYHQACDLVRSLLKKEALTLRKNRVPEHLQNIGDRQTIKLYRNRYTQEAIMFPACGSFEIRCGNLLLYSKLELQRFPEERDIMTLLGILKEEQQNDPSLMSLEKYSYRVTSAEGFLEPKACLLAQFLRYQQRFVPNLLQLNVPQGATQTKQSRTGELARLYFRRSKVSELKQPSAPSPTTQKRKKKPAPPTSASLQYSTEQSNSGRLTAPKTAERMKVGGNRPLNSLPNTVRSPGKAYGSLALDRKGTASNRKRKMVEQQRTSLAEESSRIDEGVLEGVDLRSVHQLMRMCQNIQLEQRGRESTPERDQPQRYQATGKASNRFSKEIYSELAYERPENRQSDSPARGGKKERMLDTKQKASNADSDASVTPLQERAIVRSSQTLLQEDTSRLIQSGKYDNIADLSCMKKREESKEGQENKEGQNQAQGRAQIGEAPDPKVAATSTYADDQRAYVQQFLANMRISVSQNLANEIVVPDSIRIAEASTPQPHVGAQLIQAGSVVEPEEPQCIRYVVDYGGHSISSQNRYAENAIMKGIFKPLSLSPTAGIVEKFSQEMKGREIVWKEQQFCCQDRLLFPSERAQIVPAALKYGAALSPFAGEDIAIPLTANCSRFHQLVSMLQQRNPLLLSRLFEAQPECMSRGIYTVWLCDEFWKPVTFRDTLAFEQGTPACPYDGTWVMLLQKAAALVAGGYESLRSMEFGRLYHLLTGAPTVTVKLSNIKGRNKILRKKTLQQTGVEVYLAGAAAEVHRVVSCEKTACGTRLQTSGQIGKQLLEQQWVRQFESVTLVQFHHANFFSEALVEPMGHGVEFSSGAAGLCFILVTSQQARISLTLLHTREQTSRATLIGEVSRSGSFFFGVPLATGRYSLHLSTRRSTVSISFYSEHPVTAVPAAYDQPSFLSSASKSFRDKFLHRRFRDQDSDFQQL